MRPQNIIHHFFYLEFVILKHLFSIDIPPLNFLITTIPELYFYSFIKLMQSTFKNIFVYLLTHSAFLPCGDLNAKQFLRQLTQNFILRTLNFHRNNFAFAAVNTDVIRYLSSLMLFCSITFFSYCQPFFAKIFKIIHHLNITKNHKKYFKQFMD